MWIEATTKPLKVQFRSGERRLRPGEPVQFPDDEARKLLAQAPGKVREVSHMNMSSLVGTVVSWHGERGLVRLTLTDRGAQWAWVETATREGWTSGYTEAAPCSRCHGSSWWWTTAQDIPCGFSHEWVKSSGPGRPADPDHLKDCCAHRWRWTRSLMILCATCHPPVPNWLSERRHVEELTRGIAEPTAVELVAACDGAFAARDYPAFLRERERLVTYVGGRVRTQPVGEP